MIKPPHAMDTGTNREQPRRVNLQSLPGFNLRIVNILFFLLVAHIFQSPGIRAQTGGLDSVEVILFDPLGKSTTEDGFRPVTARVSLPNNALAVRDQDFWIVQRLNSFDSKHPSQKVLQKKFTLKAGSNQVDVSFTAQCIGEYFQSEEMFIERDGNLSFSSAGNQDFCHSFHVLDWNNRLDGCFNVLMIHGSGGPCIGSSTAKTIDFRESRGGFETALYNTGDRNAPYPAALLGFDKVLWETLNMRFLSLRGDGSYSLQSGSELTDYPNAAEFILNNRWFSVGTPEQMPEDWVALVNLDLLLVSEQDLEKFSPTQLSAIQRWLAAGGRLSLINCGFDKNGLQQTFAKACGPREASDRRLSDPNWQLIAEQDQTGALAKQLTETLSGNLMPAGQPSVIECISSNRCSSRPLGEVTGIGKRDVLFFDHLFGRVICTAQAVEEFQPDDWRRMLLAAYGSGKSGNVRSTVGRKTLAGGTLGNFEVTGVSQPPRLMFLALITLFALVAGPLAYTILYRSRRVNFLLVVVPLISLLTTLGLVLYVILADGFEFQTRRLSFSRVDQNAQRAVTLTRHAVFSGTSPRSYTAEENVFFLPTHLDAPDIQQLQYTLAGSRLSANWIRARMPHQLATASVQEITAGLDVIRKEANGEVSVTVTNRFGSPLVCALLKFENQWYGVGALGVNETVSATISSPEDFEFRNRSVFEKALQTGPTKWINPSDRLGNYGQESSLVELLAFRDWVNGNLNQDQHYLALLENYPGASRLKDYARYQHQLHLIHGNW